MSAIKSDQLVWRHDGAVESEGASFCCCWEGPASSVTYLLCRSEQWNDRMLHSLSKFQCDHRAASDASSLSNNQELEEHKIDKYLWKQQQFSSVFTRTDESSVKPFNTWAEDANTVPHSFLPSLWGLEMASAVKRWLCCPKDVCVGGWKMLTAG